MPVAIKNVVTTQRGSVVIIQNGNMKAKAEIIWNDNIKRFNSQYGKAQVWLDNAVLKDSNKYIPRRTGALEKSGILGTTPGEGVVQWIAPYAHRLYYGAHLNISKAENPFARAFWFEAAKAQNLNYWLREVRHLAGGGG